MVLDTTPLRYNRNRLDAWAKRRFLRRVGSISRGIITISDFSSRCIQRDLGVVPQRITRIALPADRELAERVLAVRSASPREDIALYVGLFLPHKNLSRLIEAFGQTAFRHRGGKLLLVGGKDAAAPLGRSLSAEQRSSIIVRPSCTQVDLERLYATSLFLVQPSMEEGFGLPVQEALSSGLPACVSNGGALPEVTLGFAEHFDPTSVQQMAAAIDSSARQATERRDDQGHALSASFLARTPTIGDLTKRMLDLIDQHLA